MNREKEGEVGKKKKKRKRQSLTQKVTNKKKMSSKKKEHRKKEMKRKQDLMCFCVCERKELEKRERVKEGWCDELCEQEAEQLFKVSGRHP